MSDVGLLIVDQYDEVLLVTSGEQGPPGRAGVDGIAGGAYLAHPFEVSADVVINHNFGRRPTVQILSPGSLLVLAEVAHVNVDQVRLSFTIPQSGLALLSA